MTQIAQTEANLTILGAGAWGTMLAYLLAQNHHKVSLWTRTSEQAKQINHSRQNSKYTAELKLPTNVVAHSSLDLVADSDAVICALPSKALRSVLKDLKPCKAIISATKGLEASSFKSVTDVIAEYQAEAILAALSGPNLAKEIAVGLPAAATLACKNEAFARQAQTWFTQEGFRVYTTTDLKGVEIAGAMKNIIALAAGMSDGLKLGDNAKASLVTRGLSEVIRLGEQLGGQKATFYGLAGLGDMIATCSSTSSRNHTVGSLLSQGKTLTEIQALGLTAEGVITTQAVYNYATLQKLELPISFEVYRVLFDNKKPHEALTDLMSRSAKTE